MAAVGHRVVHGGERRESALVTPSLLASLHALKDLAPMQQPACLDAIQEVSRDRPQAVQVACFDTSFHMTQLPAARLYALPHRFADGGLRRYGFYGQSYRHVVAAIERRLGADPARRTVIAHLGAGASVTGVVGSASRGSSMGMTPLDGLPMATRCGAIDPSIVLVLQRRWDLGPREVEKVLHHESGLLGLSGLSGDCRVLLDSDDERVAEALACFVHRMAREIAACATDLDGIDLLAFTGGIGARSPVIRRRIVYALRWIGIRLNDANDCIADVEETVISAGSSAVVCWSIEADEEGVMASDADALWKAECEMPAASNTG